MDSRRITWRTGAAGVLVGTALGMAAIGLAFKAGPVDQGGKRIDSTSTTVPAGVELVGPPVVLTDPAPDPAPPTTAAPVAAPVQAPVAPTLDQRVGSLETRVDNLETAPPVAAASAPAVPATAEVTAPPLPPDLLPPPLPVNPNMTGGQTPPPHGPPSK